MIKQPMISVVMPVFNGEVFLPKAIESILKQTFKDFEFIIINDGSTDNSLEIIHKYASEDDRIKVISRENKGLVYSLNEGINESKGKYIARMDADDISDENRFIKQLNLMEFEQADICGCHFKIISDSNKLINSYIAPLTKEAIACCLVVTNPYAHGSIMLNKFFLKQNNLQYKDIKAEDHKLWSDFFVAGAKFVTVNEYLFSYRVHGNSISKSKEKAMYAEVQNNGNYLIKNFKKSFERDLRLLAKQECSFLEEQFLLMAAFKFSKIHRRLLFFNYLRNVSPFARVIVILKIISRKVK